MDAAGSDGPLAHCGARGAIPFDGVVHAGPRTRHGGRVPHGVGATPRHEVRMSHTMEERAPWVGSTARSR